MSMDQQLMQAMAAKKTGVAPEAQAPQAPQAPQPQAQQPQAPQPKAPETPTPPTAQEKASAAASPTTEGDMAQKEAVMYDVNFGDQNRQLSDKQIKSTFDRYSSLNHKHQTMKPVLDFAEQLMGAAKEKGRDVSPEQFVKGLQRAFQKNAQFGKGTNTEKTPEGKVDTPYNNASLDDDALKRWEDENAVSLPPAYKESFAQLKSMHSMINEKVLLFSSVACVPIIFGVISGKYLRKVLSEKAFRLLFNYMLLISGIVIIIKSSI